MTAAQNAPELSLAQPSAPRPDVREERYGDLRATIRTGDVVLFRGASAFSRFIKWGSRSPYSHAGFVAWWDQRLLVFQSTARGAEVLSMSAAVGTYDGRVDLFRLREDAWAKVEPDTLIATAIALLGRRYAVRDLLGLMGRMALGRFRGRRDSAEEPSEVFCSQYVSYCFRRAGIDLVPGTDDASTSPGDLARSELLVMRAMLRDDPATQARRRSTEHNLPGRPRRRPK